MKKLFNKTKSHSFILFSTIAILIVLAIILIYLKRQIVYVSATFKITDENLLYGYNNPRHEYSYWYIVGDTEKDEIGRNVAEITNVRSFQIKTEERATYITIKMKTIYNPLKNQYSFRGKTVSYGESFAFTFSKSRVKGVIVDVIANGITRTESTSIIKTQLRQENRQFSDTYGVPVYVADTIEVGDKVVDSQGNTLAEVLKVDRTPAKRTIILPTGDSKIILDPLLWDVYLTIKVSTVKFGNETYLYNYMPLKVDGMLPLFLQKITINPTIISIENL